MGILQVIGWESGGIADETKSIGNGGYTATGATISSSVVNTGGNYSLRVNATTSSVANYRAYIPDSVGGIGNGNITTSYSRFYFRYATKPASGFESFFTVEGPSSAVKIYLALTSTGTIKVGDFAGTKTDGATVLSQNTWYRIEVMCGTGTSNASWAVKVNGNPECSSSTANCNSATTATVLFGKWVDISSQTIDYYFDDFAISDSGYIGAGHVNMILPSGDASLTNWTGSYTDVDETTTDDDTTYVSSSTAGAKAYFDMSNLAGSGTFNALKAIVRVRNTGSSNNAAVTLKSGATESSTSGVDVGSSYLNLYKVFATDPDTSSAWTLSGINAVQIGPKINTAVATRCTWVAAMVDSTLNAYPVVTITSGGGTYTAGDTVTLTGTATDAEDGTISSSIVWTSDQDGSLGSGASISTSLLSASVHTITASITDSGGLTDTDTTTVTINSLPPDEEGGGGGGGGGGGAETRTTGSYGYYGSNTVTTTSTGEQHVTDRNDGTYAETGQSTIVYTSTGATITSDRTTGYYGVYGAHNTSTTTTSTGENVVSGRTDGNYGSGTKRSTVSSDEKTVTSDRTDSSFGAK